MHESPPGPDLYLQVVRILGADGEELQMISTDYHNMDGHPVTIVPDDTGK